MTTTSRRPRAAVTTETSEAAAPESTPYSARNTQTLTVPVDLIAPSAINPRTQFDQEALEELAASIQQHGILEPLLVRPMPGRRAGDGKAGPVYSLVAGERRWRAAQLAGEADAPVRVLEGLNDAEALRIALVENLQRRDLDPIEEAEGYRRLNREVGLRQAEIARQVNRSQPAVANAMRLLELPAEVQQAIRDGQLSVSHGLALAKYVDFPALVTTIATTAVEQGWSAKHLDDRQVLETNYVMSSGHVRQLHDGVGFDTSVCRQCPLQAYRAKPENRWGYPLCLRPDHFEELRAAARAERQATAQAEADARRAVAVDDGASTTTEEPPHSVQPIVVLADLEYGTYERLRYRELPSGCTHLCPCRGEGVESDGGVEAICTNPSRYRSLGAADTRVKNAAKREAYRGHLARLEAAIDRLTTPMGSVVSLAALAGALIDGERKEVWEPAVRRHMADAAEAIDLAKGQTYDRRRIGMAQALLAQTPEAILRVCIEVALRADVQIRAEYPEGKAELFDWYVGPIPEMPPRIAIEPAPVRSCEECGCTEENACEGGCAWVSPFDDLCTACVGESADEDDDDPDDGEDGDE